MNSPPNNDDNDIHETNARDYFVIRSIYEIKQLQRDINEKMDTLVNTFSAHTLEDARNLSELKISLTKLEEKDKVILKGAHLLWGAIISAVVAIGAQVIGHFLKKS
jgi:hypothetical protein